jgi:hypothetical protein
MNTATRITFAFALCLTSLSCLDPKATYEPRSGTWSYEEDAVISNTCNDEVSALLSVAITTFNLDYDEGDEFQIEQGEDDVVCEIDGAEFTCGDITGDTTQVPLLQAFVTGAVRYEGEFTNEEIANGTTTASVTCTGDDCDMIDSLPCTRVVTFSAEFQN